MSLKVLKTFNITDYELSQVQKNIKDFSNQLTSPFLDGLLIEDVEISNTVPTSVNTGLGRALSGWFVLKINQNSNVWAIDANQVFEGILVLSSSYVGTTKINLWVF